MVRGAAKQHSGDMTTIPPEAPATGTQGQVPPEGGPRVSAADIRNVTRLRRTILADRKVAGVAGGIARHLDIDPLIVRVAFVVLTLFGGGGLLLYVALWLLLPEDGAAQAAVRLDERSLNVALIGVGVIAALMLVGGIGGASWFPWTLALLALVVLLFFTVKDGRPSAPQGPPPVPPVAPPPYSQAAYAQAAYAQTAYAPTASAQTASAPADHPTAQQPIPPAPFAYAPPPRPRDPRRRGPQLFWFTLALVTLAMGVLGMADVSGADVPGSAYPALATALIGLMLLVGAFFGRAGGLIALGLLSATVLAGVTVGEHVDARTSTIRPETAGAVSSSYSQGAGELIIDLTTVSNPSALDGRNVSVEVGAGRVEVIVPDDIDVVASGSVGAGDLKLFNSGQDGLGVELTELNDVPAEQATLHLDVQLGVGEILVRTESDTSK